MTAKQVKRTFQALYALEDLRELWRKTAPHHKLNSTQRREAKALLNQVRKALEQIEEEI